MRTAIALILAIALLPFQAAAQGDARDLLSRAEALQDLGHRVRALELLEQARASIEKTPDPALEPALYGALGKAYLLTGRREDATSLLARALEAARRAGDGAITAAVLNDQGNLAVIESRAADAASAYAQSVAAARSAGLPYRSAQAGMNLARLQALAGDAGGALITMAQAEAEIAAIVDAREQASAVLSAADLLERLYAATGDRGLLERSFRSYGRALASAERSQDLRAIALARGGLARLYESEKRHAEALELNRLAIAAAQAAGADDSVYRWYWQAARVLAATGRAEDSLAAYRRAMQSFQAIRSDLVQELRAMNVSYRETVGPLFLEFADALLGRARQSPDGASAQKYLEETRDLVEQLKSVELEDYFQDECVARLQARHKTIDRVAPNTAVLYPIFLKERVEVLVSLAGGIRQVTLPATAKQLTEEAYSFRKMLEKRTTHQYRPHAERLYAMFFKPLEAQFAGERIDTVVIVPDGPLRNLPLSALHDGRDFLVRRYAFATAPGLSLISPKPIERQEIGMLITGITEGVQNFPPLPYVEEEIDAVSKIAGGKVLRDAEFRAPAFERELRRQPYSVVHIASHGHFDSDPRKSFLLTYEGKIGMDGLERYMSLTRYREDAVELLTLSACQTAAGDERAALGLAGVAVKAGARSALATLWFINDQASSQLVVEFYGQLGKPGVSKVAALQAAQQRVLDDPRYRHPGYWSPFLLIGNWL